MKLLIYNILTLLIMILGKLRTKLNIDDHRGHSGECKVVYEKVQSFTDTCCDCGLTHINKIHSLKELRWIAKRPKNYSYKWRLK